MNDNQHQGNHAQWSHNWNHMALPTFGFIFAVPEPPQSLQLPTPAPSSFRATQAEPVVAIEELLKSKTDEANPKHPHQSLYVDLRLP